MTEDEIEHVRSRVEAIADPMTLLALFWLYVNRDVKPRGTWSEGRL